MQLSARNRIKGKVKKVEKGVVAAAVKVEIMGPATITSVITKEAVEDLGLKEGDQVFVIVKSTEVMVAKE
jgi:molybdenum-pterin binding domain